MKRNPIKKLMNAWVTDCQMPQDLGQVTTRITASECVHPWRRINAVYESIWQGVEALYQTGVYPGIGFCLRHEGEIRVHGVIGHSQGNGPADERERVAGQTPRLLAADDPICLFSASKAVTAILLHTLVEAGEVNLDDRVCRYLSKLAANNSPTLLQMLSHQAGIPRLQPDRGIETLFDYDAMVALIYDTTPEWAAGDKVGYHAISSGYLISEVIRCVTGLSIDTYLTQRLVKPLGLDWMGYGVSAQKAHRVCHNYFTGLPVTPPLSTVLNNTLGASVETVIDVSNDHRFHTAVIPSASIMTTAEEASRLFQMLLQGGVWQGNPILKPETIARATQAHNKLRIDTMLKVPIRYTPGMMLGEHPIGLFGPFTKRAFGHLGFTNNLCWADPDRDIAVALLTTGKPVVGPHLSKLVTLLTRIGRLSKTSRSV